MLCPESIAASVTAIAIGLARNNTAEENALIAAIFEQLGDVLSTLAAAQALIEAKCPHESVKTDADTGE